MKFTPFAALTELEEGESPFEAGSTFTDRDRREIDRLLRLGAKTHRHDGRAGLARPDEVPVLTAATSGGSFPPDVEVFVTYTAVDSDGGETLPADVESVITAGSLLASGTPTTTVQYDLGGTILPNVYYYVLTTLDGEGGESAPADPVAVVVDPGHVSARIVLSDLDDLLTVTGAAEWRLYRSVNGGTFGLLGQGATATFTDDGQPCIDPQMPPPEIGSTSAASSVEAVVPATGLPADAVAYRLYAAADDEFASPALVGEFLVADAGDTHVIQSLGLQSGSPPPISTSVGGAPKITADDLEDGLLSGGGGGGAGAAGVMPSQWGFGNYDPGSYTEAQIRRWSVVWPLDDEIAGVIYMRLNDVGEEIVREVYENYVPADWNGDTSQWTWDGTVLSASGAVDTDWLLEDDTNTLANGTLELDYAITDANGWDRIFVGAHSGGGLGYAALMDRAAGELQLVEVTAVAPLTYTVVASIGLADGWTPPLLGETGNLVVRRYGNHYFVTEVRDGNLNGNFDAGIPTDFGSAEVIPFFGGRWNAADAFNVVYLAWLEHPGERLELVASSLSAGPAYSFDTTTEEVLWDNGNEPESWSAVPVAGADWTITGFILKERGGAVRMQGAAVKSAGTAPVDGEVIAELDLQESGAYIFDPFQETWLPVVTGNDTTEAVGFVVITQADYGTPTPPQIVWRQGVSTDPATTNPFVRVEAVRYQAVV